MYHYNDFNIVSSKADYKLFTDTNYQLIIDHAIERLLHDCDRMPNTLWIDTDNNMLHMWDSSDRKNTERVLLMEQ